MQTTTHDLKAALKEHFGFNQFRPYQETIVSAMLSQKDVVAILPTGSGKSLCYQLPALISNGLYVVISPLIALMNDQVMALQKWGISAIALNSQLGGAEAWHAEQNLSEYRLVYVSPERLANPDFMERVAAARPDHFIVDEAHCISSWGHAFRPDYRLLTRLKSSCPQTPIAAFTATATARVCQDIQDQLMLTQPEVIQGSFDRPNLRLNVEDKRTPLKQLMATIEANPEGVGIVYCSTRKEVDRVTNDLVERGIKAAGYHAGLSDSVRKQVHNTFRHDQIQIVVATVAFGMGIDKPDIRFVFHMNMPANIEQYYQEIGRAGRDGLESSCTMLVSLKDLVLQKQLIQDIPDVTIQRSMKRKIDQLFAYCQSVRCRRIELLGYFGESFTGPCNHCDNCLNPPEQIDGTEMAQKILSCVYRLRQNFGVIYVCDILLGSTRKDILTRGHDRLSTYGLLKDLDRNTLEHYIFSLINLEALYLTDGQFPVLKLGKKCRPILRGDTSILFKKQTLKPKRPPKIKATQTQITDPDLFEKLRQLRRQLADAAKIPPFMIFSDKTLIELAHHKPISEPAFLEINGVGPQKNKTYGSAFRSEIQTYLGNKSSA